jgi:hypothetical protein
MAAELRDLASQVPTAIFRYFGATVLGIPPIDAAPATVPSTWTMVDNAGYTIPAGTQVTIAASGSDLYGFEVITDVVVPPGNLTTAAGEVELQALIAGADANALSAAPQPVDSLAYVASIVLVGATADGVDAELDADYLDRLVQELELLTPRPIVADDFATIWRITTPGVHRSLGLDGYDPVAHTYNNERTVAIVGLDDAGEAVSPALKTAGQALFAVGGPYEREANFIVNTFDPSYTNIDVSTQVVVEDGWDDATVIAAVEAALADYLSPANWGRRSEREALGASLETDSWEDEGTVYYLEVAQVINNVDGVDRIVALTVDGGIADIVLTGPASLTRPGVITVTV